MTGQTCSVVSEAPSSEARPGPGLWAASVSETQNDRLPCRQAARCLRSESGFLRFSFLTSSFYHFLSVFLRTGPQVSVGITRYWGEFFGGYPTVLVC